jgi:hypothetical protein
MRLSKLQKFILTASYTSKQGGKLKKDFYSFYPDSELKNNLIGIQVSLQKSLDNLTEKDLLVAFGHKTARKWFIHKVKLTNRGKRLAKQLIASRQRKLPIK